VKERTKEKHGGQESQPKLGVKWRFRLHLRDKKALVCKREQPESLRINSD
jgi:hypothetical protein